MSRTFLSFRPHIFLLLLPRAPPGIRLCFVLSGYLANKHGLILAVAYRKYTDVRVSSREIMWVATLHKQTILSQLYGLSQYYLHKYC